MKCLKQGITDFTYTNLTESIPAWNSTTTYVFESGTPTSASLVLYGIYIYRSVTNDNLNYNPEEYLNVKWVKWGISNKYALLDMRSLSKSTYIGDLIVEFNVGFDSDSIVLGNYSAEHIEVECYDGLGNLIYTFTSESTINENVNDYFSYIYSDYGNTVDRALLVNIPPVLTEKVRVTLFAVEGESSIGYLVGGASFDMGTTLQSISFGFNSYAVKTFDDFGSLSIEKRNVQDVVDFETVVKLSDMVYYKKKLKSFYNEVVVFVLDESENSIHENLITLGVVESANIVVSNSVESIFSWSIIEAVS